MVPLATLAAYVPARRALHVDPIVAHKSELNAYSTMFVANAVTLG